MRLIDTYRPRAFDEFVGNAKAVERVRSLINRPNFSGDAFWIVGPSGCGKTSLAHCICNALTVHSSERYELDGDACSVDAVRDVAERLQYSSLTGGWRAWIVNEAQAMTARAVQAWLNLLDRLPTRGVILFTTTESSEDLFGQYDGPFRSRCKTIALSSQGLCDAFAERCREIAQAMEIGRAHV